MTVISVHAPTEERDEVEKESFYDILEEVWTRVSYHDLLLVMGDFNAKIGKMEDQKQVARHYTLHERCNDNGNMTAQFAARNKLYIRSTSFPHKKIHLGTWKIPGSEEVNQIDHVLVSARHRSSMMDVRSCRGPNCNSDNFFVKVKVRERIANAMKTSMPKTREGENENFNKNKEAREHYQAGLARKLKKD
ncbi:craniofacial development protein 2-like [Bemisia tabaci]|uniref:craniofacial development protein 2-like n=1 Tax=Bemisia tabaci TaxID=7038 RepID=UPI003B289CD6